MNYIILLAGLFNLLLGVSVILKDGNRKANKLFLYFCLNTAILSFLNFIFLVYPWLAVLKTIHAIAVFSPVYAFAWVYELTGKSLSKFRKWLALAPAFLFFGLAMFTDLIVRSGGEIVFWGVRVEFGPFFPAYSAYIILILAHIIFALKARIAEEKTYSKMQLIYILTGLASYGLLAVVFSLILPACFGYYHLTMLDSAASLLFAAFSAYAIARYRFMNIKFYLRKSAVILYTVLIVVVVSLIVRDIIFAWGFDDLYVDILLVIFPFFLFVSLRRLFYFLANHYLRASLYYPELVIKEIDDKLRQTFSVMDIGALLNEFFRQTFHISQSAILEIGYNQAKPAILYNQGFVLNSGQLLQQADLADLFPPGKEKILIAEEFIHRHYLDQEKEMTIDWFQSVGFAILAPLSGANAILGFLLLGPKDSGDVFTREDLRVIKKTAKAAAVALAAAKRYENQQEVIKEMGERIDSLEKTKQLTINPSTSSGQAINN